MSFRPIAYAAAASLLALSAAAHATLPVGAKAPEIVTKGALAGNPFTLDLQKQLKKGPVVLYFFPAAFTPGCTMEAHEFAESVDDFRKAGASVVGMSADGYDKLANFSKLECRNKFPVATATPETISAYDVKLGNSAVSNRTSYVIAPNGTILYAHSDLDYRDHVKNTLAAVQSWKAKQK